MTTSMMIYAALLILVLLTPYMSVWLAPHPDRPQLPDWHFCALMLAGAVILTAGRNGAFPMIGVFVLIPVIGLGLNSLLGGLTAALLFATAIWWTSSPQLGPVPLAVAALLALTAGFLPRWEGAPAAGKPRFGPVFLLCTVIGLAPGLLTAPFESSDTIYYAWHHWGAYLAPVEAWRGGGAPYRDFPIQYGLGPTLLLLGNCGQDCWRGMYETVVVANALYFATLAGSVIILTARSRKGVRWLALLAMFCATFVWTGFPIHFAGPVITPSVAGLRFLSISALLLHILYAEQQKVRRDWIGHSLWLIDLLWSPEATFFGTLVWWPYLALRDAGAANGWRGALGALARGGVRCVCALAIGFCGLALLLWFLSAGSVTLSDFLAYVQHPPGVLPVNPVGTIWIALAVIALGIIVLTRQGLSDQGRPFYACMLGFVGAGTYYISRSHDNNILNLFPFLILALLGLLANLDRMDASAQAFFRTFAHTTLVAMIAFVATFNFEPWREGAVRAGPLKLGAEKLISRFSPGLNDRPAVLPPDALAGLRYLAGRNAGAVLLLDDNKVMPRSSGAAWTGVNNAANFAPLPDAMILSYIRRGAVAYRRSGWILADTAHRPWVNAFKSAYDVREQKSFGVYQAFYLVPRQHF